MADYPETIVPVDHVEPVPRRVRAVLAGEVIVDTLNALYVWEWPPYPQFYLPLADFAPGVLEDEGSQERSAAAPPGATAWWPVTPGGRARHRCSATTRSRGLPARCGWSGTRSTPGSRRTRRCSCTRATRSPGPTRCAPPGPSGSSSKARSSRTRPAPVMVFETGLPPRYYVDPSTVDFDQLVPQHHRHGVPVQGPDQQLLVHPGRRPDARGPGLVLRLPHARDAGRSPA